MSNRILVITNRSRRRGCADGRTTCQGLGIGEIKSCARARVRKQRLGWHRERLRDDLGVQTVTPVSIHELRLGEECCKSCHHGTSASAVS
jgi:hypothetical protein